MMNCPDCCCSMKELPTDMKTNGRYWCKVCEFLWLIGKSSLEELSQQSSRSVGE